MDRLLFQFLLFCEVLCTKNYCVALVSSALKLCTWKFDLGWMMYLPALRRVLLKSCIRSEQNTFLKTFCILSVSAFDLKAHWNYMTISQWYLIFTVSKLVALQIVISHVLSVLVHSQLIIMDSSSPKGQVLPPLYESNLSSILEKTFF